MEADLKLPATQSSKTGFSPEALDLKAASNYTSFTIHSLPDIPANAQIIGVCTLQKADIAVDKHAWIVADVLAVKQMLFREGNKDDQTWLASTDMANIVKDLEETHISVENITKSPQSNLSEIHGKDVSAATSGLSFRVYPSADSLFGALVKEVRQRAKIALKKDTALVIIGMGLSTASQDLVLGASGQIIHSERLAQAAGSKVPVTLITPAAFSGGWQVNTELGRKHGSIPDATRKSLIALSCELAFTPSRDIKDKAEMVNYALQLDGTEKGKASAHTFNFDQISDEWEKFWMKRVGAPLSYWKGKWDTLPTVTVAKERDAYDFLGGAFGLTKASQLSHIALLAAHELDTCPGDWNKAFNAVAKDILQPITRGSMNIGVTEKETKDALALVRTRTSSIVMADIVRSLLDLPRPQEKNCRYWNYQTHNDTMRHDAPFRAGFSSAWSTLLQFWPGCPGSSVSRHSDDVNNYCRPTMYLAAAVATQIVLIDCYSDVPSINEYVKVQVGGVISMISESVSKLSGPSKDGIQAFVKQQLSKKNFSSVITAFETKIRKPSTPIPAAISASRAPAIVVNPPTPIKIAKVTNPGTRDETIEPQRVSAPDTDAQDVNGTMKKGLTTPVEEEIPSSATPAPDTPTQEVDETVKKGLATTVEVETPSPAATTPDTDIQEVNGSMKKDFAVRAEDAASLGATIPDTGTREMTGAMKKDIGTTVEEAPTCPATTASITSTPVLKLSVVSQLKTIIQANARLAGIPQSALADILEEMTKDLRVSAATKKESSPI